MLLLKQNKVQITINSSGHALRRAAEFGVIRSNKQRQMKILETERIIIRHLSINDLEPLSVILRDPDVMKHSVNGVMSREATLKFINDCIQSYKENEYGPWALIDKNKKQLIGFSGINEMDFNCSSVTNLGYRLAKEYWNKGYATEAVENILEHILKI